MLLGAVLAASIGPIFFALVQTSLRQGVFAGLLVGAGIWVSDLLFILANYWGISQVTQLRDNETFTLLFGLAGGALLVGFGLFLFFKPPPTLAQMRGSAIREDQRRRLWLTGFIVNTANPFTVFFWLTTMTDGLINRHFSGREVLLFFGGVMLVIIVTDALKAYFADRIRHRLLPVHLKWFGRLAGVIVAGFGIAVAVRGASG